MSTSNNSNYGSNGQYILSKLSLFVKKQGTDDEVEWDLKPSFIECSLFEALGDQTMSGYVAVLDSLNVADILPLYGNERVELEFYTAGSEDNLIEYVGYVYKISERVQVTEQTSGYIIRFCSEAAILSERVFTQSGYEDTADQIVEQIYTQYLEGETKKPIYTQPARHIQTLTIGTIHPLDGIAIATRRAIAADGTAGFIFYENNKEFRFETLQSMYQKEPIASYSTVHRGVFDDVKERTIESFERVQRLEYDEENSLLDRLLDGVHGSNHVFFDLVTKQVVTHHYRKEDFFDKEKSLGEVPNKKEIEDGTDVTFLSYVNNEIQWTLDEVISKMARIESETFRARITVFGDSNLRVGEVIECYFPRMNNAPEEVANIFEGKVLIGAIRHTITKDKYMQEIEVIRDGYNEGAQ